MRKKLHLMAITILLSVFVLFSTNTLAAGKYCDPCEDIPWNPEQIHQFYFNPSDYPSCFAFAEIHYRTKMCNGMLMYEITDVEYTFIKGGCCVFAHLHKDVEKEMILKVLGTPNVISSKPSSCYRELELDPDSDPDFKDCWTHHGDLKFEGNPIMFSPCSNICCVAKATVKYDAKGRPIIFWDPLTTSECDETIPVPTEVTFPVCCEIVIDSAGEGMCTDFRTFTLKVKSSDKCIPYCSGSMFFRKVSSEENANLIQENINFHRDTKVYPNPFKNNIKLNLVLPADQTVSVELLDMTGKLVKSYDVQYQKGRTEYELNTPEELSPGFYLCRVNTVDYGNTIIKIKKQ